ncbi:MAG: formyltransferase family protein [Pseudomonadota bacterium]
MAKNAKIGVLCSAGGSAFFAGFDLCRAANIIDAQNVFLLTDRACDAEARAHERSVASDRLVIPDAEAFSVSAARAFLAAGCDMVLMLFGRLVTADLYQCLPTLNIHPALLPAFPGMHAVRRARDAGVRFLGATLHVADESVDGGPIIAQTVAPIDPASELSVWNRRSYSQKAYLSALTLEAIACGRFVREGRNIHLEGSAPEGDFDSRTASNFASKALRARFDDFCDELDMLGGRA